MIGCHQLGERDTWSDYQHCTFPQAQWSQPMSVPELLDNTNNISGNLLHCFA